MSRYLNESGRHGKENLNDLKLPIINQMQPSHTTRQPNSISPRRHYQGTKLKIFSLPQEHNPPQQDAFSQYLSRLENERGPLNKNLQWQPKLIASKSHHQQLHSEKRTGLKCSLEKASELAFKYRGTLLYTNQGITYWSNRIRHAEETFIQMVPDVQGINDIWIKNSPCSRCAVKLRQHFNEPPKPTLHIGKLWKVHEGKNEKGLKEMKREGFKLKAWYAKEIWGSYMTANYLRYL